MEKIERKISEKLHNFNSAKEWSDLITIIRDLNKILQKNEKNANDEKNSNFNLSLFKEKITLSKRLAQCLNPSLPSGLHEVTLDSYQMILKNVLSFKQVNNSLGDDLPLYASGLFPFFQNASIQNKQKYLQEIIEPLFLQLNPIELELILPGLLSSIIPALDEQHEMLVKNIKEIFKSICTKVTSPTFYGCLWTIIIRNPPLRSSIIKYFIESIPNYQTYSELNNEEKKIYKENYFPKMHTLIINSLCVILEDQDLLTKRNGMDFIIKTLPIDCENSLLLEILKTTLLKSALKLFVESDYSITRRLKQWMFSSSDTRDIELDINSTQIKLLLKLIVSSLKELFLSAETLDLLSNIKILNTLFSHQYVLSEYIMDKISYDIISCTLTYWSSKLNESEKANNDEVITKVRNFFISDDSFLKWLWKSLGNNLSTLYLTMNSKEKIKNLKSTGVVDRIIKPLKFCLLYINVNNHNDKVAFYIPIISQLFQILNAFEIDSRQSLQDIKQIIFILLDFVKKLQTDDDIAKTNTLSFSKRKIDEHNEYENIVEIVNNKYRICDESSFQFISQNLNDKEILEMFTSNILLFQQYYILIIEQLKSIISKNESLNITEMNIFKQSTELIIRIQEYSQQNEIPKWLFYLEQITFCNNMKLSLEAIRYMLYLMMINYKSQVYLNIKEHIYNKDIDKKIISQQQYDKLITVTNNQGNYASMLMAFLWNMLNIGNNQRNVIDLLIIYFKVNQKLFVDVIKNTLAINNSSNDKYNSIDITENINAVKRFSQFWKLTNELYRDMNFFPNGDCIFTMVDFLENEHPLIRHLAKSWLNQSIPQIDKIINPILNILFSQEISWNISNDNQQKIYIDKYLDNKKIIDAFRKLKNIIINSAGSGVVKSLSLHKCNKKIIDDDKFGNSLEQNLLHFMPRTNYLELLVNISLRFIKVQVINETNSSHCNDYYNINAASCEFLEFLLGFIEDKSDLMFIATYITNSVIESLYERLETNDEVMQLQLLNLLKVLLIDTKDEHIKNNFKNKVIDIIQNKILLNCFIEGIKINNFFIRGYFISFIESCLPIYTQILDEVVLNETAFSLIKTTTFFLAERVKSIKQDDNNNDNNDGNKFIVHNYVDGFKEKILYDENDLYIIVKGLRSMIFHFLSINNPINCEVNWITVKKYISSSNSSQNNHNKHIVNYFNCSIEKSIISNIFNKQLEDIISSFMIVWINNQNNNHLTKDYCLNDKGILSYDSNSEITNEFVIIEDSSRQNELKQIIVNIALNMFVSNPIDFINHFMSVWMNLTDTELITNYFNHNIKLSLIELLIEMNIPFHILLFILSKIIVKRQRKQAYIKGRSKQYVIPINERSFESKLCHFLYSYIVYSKALEYGTNYNEIWNEIINFFNVFLSNTKIAYSLCWIYELMKLTLLKYSINKITGENNIKKQLVAICDNLNKRLMDIAFNNKFECIYESNVKLPIPILPSLYSNINNAINSKDKNDESEITKFYIEYYTLITNDVPISNEVLMECSRKIVFLTLKYNYYIIIYNLYKDKSTETIKMVNSLLLKLISTLSSLNENQNSKIVFYGDFYDELSVDFIHSLMMNCPKITSQAGKQIIMDYFNNDSFFSTTPKIIRLWKDIICYLSMYHNDIITDLMNLMEKGYFTFKTNSNQIIKSLRRISFVIYSCNKDTFGNKLSIIKEKVKDLFISYGNAPIIEREIFLMIRVLFLRFSHDNIMEMIRALWPIIFSELIMIINGKKKKKINELIIESFKFVELLSLANIEEFLLYQWIFIVDTFDVKKLKLDEDKSLLTFASKYTAEEMFRPIVMNCCSFCEEVKAICGDTIFMEGRKKAKTKLIITGKYVSKEKLEYQLRSLFYSISDMNNYPVTVNYDQIEKVIEMDFIEELSS